MPTENRITEQPDEVKRYRFKGAAGEYVYAADFDAAKRDCDGRNRRRHDRTRKTRMEIT
ncbi:hypothetical protein [Pseudomonas sp. TNT3]|uniref:hypothetical protein n=1 Tax=Pseudomonas sp. TNT3 TaxID=2654097 RepID=UPI0013912477|nr:hypothetical protein [Pseudomonas sp. TNT3]KAI2693254.1 hypothetical protein GBC55_006930 [Pseudomonas sp. TNT3]